MGDDGMRQDLKRAFGDLTEPPDSGMRHRVMNAVRAGGESGPRHQWAVALATAVITVALVGGFLLTRLPLGGSGAPIGPGPAASPSPTPATPTETPSPTPSATPVPQAVCTSDTQSGGGTATVNVTAVRVGQQSGYDRFVIEFDGPVPSYQVSTQSSATFTEDASGRTVVLDGKDGVVVTIHGANDQGYSGSTDFKTGYPQLREARRTGSFEAVVHWGLGTSGPACLKVSTLTGPDRLVIDLYPTP